jgi:hypothetical protein
VQTSPIGASSYSPKLVANSVINSATYGCSGTWQKRRKVPSFLRAEPGSVTVSSSPGAVVEVDHAVAETAFAQQFELHTDIVGEGPFAASHHDGRDEQVALVDQPGPERLGAASSGPPTIMSRPADAFIFRTASGSNSRSIRVLAVDTASSVPEYTILLAACQSSAKSRIRGDCSAREWSFSQPTIVSYIRRP